MVSLASFIHYSRSLENLHTFKEVNSNSQYD